MTVSRELVIDEYYGGTKDQWEKINIERWNNSLINANVYYCVK